MGRSFQIACLVIVPFLAGCQVASRDASGSSANAERMREYDRQMAKVAEQQAITDKQIQAVERQRERMDALLDRWEKQADRYDAILSRWEKQRSKEGS